MTGTGASDSSLPPVLWNVLCASCCVHEGTVSITRDSLIQFNEWACGWSRCVNADTRKIGKNMMQFPEFLMSVAPLFQHELSLCERVRPGEQIFIANVIPVLLHDWHGQVLTCSERQHVESTVRSKLLLSLDDRPAKRPALGYSGFGASASSSTSAATGSGGSHEHGESRNGFAQACTSPSDSVAEDDNVQIAARAPTRAHTAASSSDTREKDVQISVLERENHALRLLLQSKDEKSNTRRK